MTLSSVGDPERWRAAHADSRVLAVAARIETAVAGWLAGSRLVGWFRAEPDPGVIVIDLRETHTVGPLLALLAWLGVRLETAGRRRQLDRLAAAVATRLAAAPVRQAGWLVVAGAVAGLALADGAGARGGWLLVIGLALLATRDRRPWPQLRESRIGRLLAAVFAPPDPPERDRR